MRTVTRVSSIPGRCTTNQRLTNVATSDHLDPTARASGDRWRRGFVVSASQSNDQQNSVHRHPGPHGKIAKYYELWYLRRAPADGSSGTEEIPLREIRD